MTRRLIGLVALALFAPGTAIAQTPPGTDDGDYEQVPVGGDVPATLTLNLGPAATFGAFEPGVDGTYTTSMTASVISTAGDALLSVADPSSLAPGHLVNGTFSLPQPLQAEASSPAGAGSGYAARRRAAVAAHLHGTGHQRQGHDRLQPGDRRHRRAAHGDLQQEAHVHALDDQAVATAVSLRGRDPYNLT